MKTQTRGQRNHDQRLEELAQEVYLSLFRTHEALLSEFKLLLKEQGLSDPQYNVLRILEEAMSQTDVSRLSPGA